MAVIDSGIYAGHDDFTDRVSPLSKNITTGQIGLGAVGDSEGHGTGVSGVFAAATHNQKCVAGVSGGWASEKQGATILTLKAEDSQEEWSAAIEYAIGKASIINLSNTWYHRGDYLMNTISSAHAAGMVIVGAAGNGGLDVDPTLPDYTRAILDKILVVAATDQQDLRWNDGSFASNYGVLFVDVSAPGKDIPSTSLGPPTDAFRVYNGENCGTSLATPHVSGLAAILLGMGKRRDDVYSIIRDSADSISQAGPGMGTGRINMYTALRMALDSEYEKDTTPPGKPTDGMLLPGPMDIQVTWRATDNDAVGECFLYRRRGSGPGCADPETLAGTQYCLVAEIPSSAASGDSYQYTDTDILEAEQYYYRIVAVDKTGNRSEPSDELGPAHHMLAPARPTNLQAKTGNGQVHLTWDSNVETDLDNYSVYYSRKGFGSPDHVRTVVEPSGGSTESADLTGLINDKQYFIWVTAVDEVGNESAYASVTSKPLLALWVHAGYGAYASIGAALADAGEGALVMVGPGDYPSDPLYVRPRVTLRSELGAGHTRIIGNGVTLGGEAKLIGFTIVNNGIACDMDGGAWISNNVVIGSTVGIDMLDTPEQPLEGNHPPMRVYNNSFINNDLAILVTSNICTSEREIRNNIFQATDPDQTGIHIDMAKGFYIRHNSFDGYADGHAIFFVGENIVRNNHFQSPGFVAFDPADPASGDYHLQSGSWALEAGSPYLKGVDKPWTDCDGSAPALGAYGGPYAYREDENGDGLPDCMRPVAYQVTTGVMMNSVDHPITFSAQDPGGCELAYNPVAAPANGTLVGVGGAQFYTPAPGYFGSDSFTYKAVSDYAESNEATVNINVKQAETQPAALGQTVKVHQSAVMVALDLAGTDQDGDPLTCIVDSEPSITGSEPPVPVGEHYIGHLPEYYYWWPGGFLGSVSFDFHVNDGTADSAPATVNIVIYNEPVVTDFYPQSSVVNIGEDGSQLFWIMAYDPDGVAPNISYTWTLDGYEVATGNSYAYNADLPGIGGTHDLTVTMDDGITTITHSWTIVVHETIILDDGACTFSGTGTWSTSNSGAGYLNSGYMKRTPGSAGEGYAHWYPTLSAAGNYRVYARWPANSAYDPDAVFRIYFAGGRYDDIEVDQTKNGGQWNLLGTYYFNEGTTELRLKIGVGDIGVADAVKLVATDDPADIILDNAEGVADPGADWVTHNQYDYHSGYFYDDFRAAPPGSGGRTFTWTPALTAPGTYQLYAWWSAVNGGATNAKYFVYYDAARNTQITVDQTINRGHWTPLGTYYFAEGDTPTIVVNDNATGTVVADAVKLVFLNRQVSNIVDNDSDSDYTPADSDHFGWDNEGICNWVGRTNYPGFIGSGFRQIAADPTDPQCLAKWILPISEDGNYEVYARWASNSDRSTAARYEIIHGGVTDVVVVDQTANGGEWYYLGRYYFDSLLEKAVTLRQSADKVVAADAVMYLKTDEDLPIVVDNSDVPLFLRDAGWVPPSPWITGYWGEDFLQTTSEIAATWMPPIATAGNYEIYARWTAAADRSNAVSYSIQLEAGQEAVVTKNQRNNGGKWVSLGRYYQPQGQGWIQVQAQANGVTVADAVRLDYTATPLATIIDNKDTEPPDYRSTIAGTWTPGNAFAGFYDTNYLYHAPNTGAVVRWTPLLPARGYYGLYAWWPVADTTFGTNSPFKIVHPGAPAGEMRYMNQQINGGKWNYLGTFLFDAGEAGYIELSDAANGKVLADAVKFNPE